MELHQLMMPTAPPIPLDPLLEAALARKNLWESNRRAPKGLSVILPDGYTLSNDSPLGMIPIDDEPSPENEEKEEVFKILMICGAVLFLFILILIILRVLILLKSCQHKALKKEQEKQNKKLEALKIQIER